jgi:type I restriction enzyme S subunit
MNYPAYAEYEESGVRWIGQRPKHWQVMTLHHMARMNSGASIASLEMDDQGEYPVFGGNGNRGRFSQYTHDGSFVLIGRQGAECGKVN